ncbi:MAG: polysaccharide deacetylase family protein [Treponema sp.]|jgi:peptidoglycan/xylan/chitin deacetylase (PgdA/CDA1 family)|nr:polysaccharide deacetylase family protein [Treponema sp.]
MKIRTGFCCFLLALALPPVFAKVTFQGLDLSDDNRLLFRADSSGGGALPQNSLFISRLTDLALQQMTAFPEKMELVNNGRILQVRNAFGVLRLPSAGGLPQGIPGFPSFATGASALGGRVEDMAASQDGRWILYLDPVTPAYGNLVLVDVNGGAKRIVARNVERPGRFFPACWSPDSRVFVYSRGGRLFYYPVYSAAAAPADERYRLIGEGAINAVSWSRMGDFYYLRGSTVYRVRGSELFARALYADFLEIGALAGKLPVEFDQNFDDFWIAPDSRSLLLSKGGRNIFYYPLDGSDMESVLPYVIIPRSAYNINVLWSPAGVVTVIASALKAGGPQVMAWRLETGRDSMSFIPLETPVGSQAALSPDGSRALFWGDRGVVLYDYINWRALLTLGTGPTHSCIWINNEEFITGDSYRIERIKVSGSSGDAAAQRTMLCLSGAAEYGFEEKGGRIFAKNNGAWFVSDGKSPWEEAANPALRKPSQASGRYRVYLERQSAGLYENLPMIRNIASVGTAALLPGFRNDGERYPPRALSVSLTETSPPGVFAHGLREGLREAALCFDLYDDAAGLPQTLDALNRFGVRATFFLNGEFIRRHPDAAKDIAAAGHEAASMFFAPIDLSDARYRLGDDFIGRGLARNEDEYFQAAGAELSLLWHAPYFKASAEIAAAASRAGYRTVDRDVDPLDWVSREDARNLGLTQYSAAAMIDRIMNMKRPGSIIPIRLGLLPGGRQDYLYLRIEVLLDALIRDGYSVVPVSTIIDHAR